MHVESASTERTGQPLHRLHLLYHELRPGGSKYSYVLTPLAFDRHLDLFVQLRKDESRAAWPEVTFDDGHISNYEYALPALDARGMIARFFITVGWVGKKPGFMGWPELRSLQQSGQLIGAHGWSHTLLTHCNREELNRELSGAKQMLEDKLGTQITTMSLPGGRHNRHVLAACREAGYIQIFTSVPRPEPTPLGFLVGRLNIRGDMMLDYLRALHQSGSRALASLERQSRLKATAQTVMGDKLYEKLWGLLNRKEPEGGEDNPA